MHFEGNCDSGDIGYSFVYVLYLRLVLLSLFTVQKLNMGI